MKKVIAAVLGLAIFAILLAGVSTLAKSADSRGYNELPRTNAVKG